MDKRHNQAGARALQRAIEIAKGQAALGRAIGRAQSTVWGWLQTGVPDEGACEAIERATGGKVTCAQLRPDLWGGPVMRRRMRLTHDEKTYRDSVSVSIEPGAVPDGGSDA